MRSARRVLAVLALLLTWLVNVAPVGSLQATEAAVVVPNHIYDGIYTPTDAQAITCERGPPATGAQRFLLQSIRLATLDVANGHESLEHVYDLPPTPAFRNTQLPVGVGTPDGGVRPPDFRSISLESLASREKAGGVCCSTLLGPRDVG